MTSRQAWTLETAFTTIARAKLAAAGVAAIPERPRPHGITKRQCQVLLCASHGLQTKETAVVLGLAVDTVNDHEASARRKLAAKNMAHALAIALRAGLIE